YVFRPEVLDTPSSPSFPTRRSSDLDSLIHGTVGHSFSKGALRLAARQRGRRVLGDDRLLGDRQPDLRGALRPDRAAEADLPGGLDRKSTRLNSSHLGISYAVFCLKK